MTTNVGQSVRAGFSGSETSRPQIILYSHTGDPIVIQAGGPLSFDGVDNRASNPCLIQVQTNKTIGAASGTWNFSAKVPANSEGLFDRIVDNDWVDIVFTRHGKQFHVMRGLVDEVRRNRQVSGRGTTQTVWTVAGRDFGKIWEHTPVWFSTYCRENVHGHFSAQVFQVRSAEKEESAVAGDALVLNSPQAAVRGYLLGFLERLGDIGRENWTPPVSLPAITNNSFVQSLYFKNDGFTNLPPRIGIDPNFITAGGTLWDLAKEWSDPLFTELFVDLVHIDLLNGGSPAGQDLEATVQDTVMAITFRDKPFVVNESAWTGEVGADSPWFALPLFEVPWQMVTNSNVGRSGLERFNAYFVTSPLHQESLGAGVIDLLQPLWDKADIQRHGLRRMDISSKYQDAYNDLLNLSSAQRAMVKDWYCLNPYFLNGSLSLGRGLPELRVGTRLRVKGPVSPARDETYYVESVAHDWQLQPGLKTNVGVTRGWIGSDMDLVTAVQTAGSAERYINEAKAES